MAPTSQGHVDQWRNHPPAAAGMFTDREKVRLDFFQHFQKTHSRFGWPEKREVPVMVILNKKGGMTDAELKKYADNNLFHLFLDVFDEPGKCVCLKFDNGPGRWEITSFEDEVQNKFILNH